MIKAGIVGGSGYTGGELIRLLLQHPEVEIDFIYSSTRPGDAVGSAHPDLWGETELNFSGSLNPEVDVVFLCLGHGHSANFLKETKFARHPRIVDLSADFRLSAQHSYNGMDFVYGLPELSREEISSARYIANPGCFATAIQLAMLPLANEGLLNTTMHISGITGSTGAGIKPSDTSHFSWRNNNISWYKPFTHQHLNEVRQSLGYLDPNLGDILFLPHRGNFARGILITAYLSFKDELEQASELYKEYYKGAAFTHIVGQPIHLKQVVNTNNCHVHLHKHEEYLLVTSAIDNLLKGASGQAVQNMNLMFDIEEVTGLKLKAGAF